jgi:Fe-S-cluster containining protein
MDPARELVQIVDAAMAEAVRKAGSWLACRPGCWQCCIGPFPISQADALRLREGLAELSARDPARAAAIRRRAQDFAAKDERSGAEDEPCPALDPAAGTCDLYAFRPLTCRTFGPAVRWGGDALGVCELCFEGASDEEIAACVVDIDTEGLEDKLLDELAARTGARGQTLVALALR